CQLFSVHVMVMVRKNFSFGARSKNFWNQNEKFLARVFTKTRTAIRPFSARNLPTVGSSFHRFV
ncbi:hypothetical protein NLB62_09820, partial [Porphyromonas gingivalis]|nr:hypothetical protein [Porphyromonas gingivalis]